MLHDASGAGAGAPGTIGEARRQRPGPQRGSATAAGLTDERGELTGRGGREAVVDPEALRRARRIASRLALPRPRREPSACRSAGELVSVPYGGSSDEIDIDRTLAALVEHPLPSEQDVIVRERVRTRRAVVLLVDVSGSMRGERLLTAAATVGALASELIRDDLAVIAFWSDAVVLQHLGQRRPPQSLVEDLLAITARGLTNVEFPLRVAARELAQVAAADARAILLSDCVHNAGPDPRSAAGGLPRCDVALDASGERDADLARDLARLGRGRLSIVHTHRDAAPAISRLFQR